ncbi:hypothetical protein [Streptacidiphilus melanogenes]|uniref:hypothetical protein n=1 Tax=Streptacidiphilus melanogenes TaxID=411235 RepID=UPI00126A5CF2|nr:hypothetical protein [Streptacidiphilus melanogenes]
MEDLQRSVEAGLEPMDRKHAQALVENTQLKQRLRQAESESRTLQERLRAAQSNLRFQDRRLASVEAELLDRGLHDPPTRSSLGLSNSGSMPQSQHWEPEA